MPYIIGDTASEANGVIIAAGFITGAVDQTPNPAPAGTVIYQYPLAGSMPDPGSPVNYTLSMGIGGGSAYGKFVGSWVGKAIELTNIGDIEPKVWRPIHVQTARSRS
jgi:beta-lactam-binding protein with PASTA domain